MTFDALTEDEAFELAASGEAVRSLAEDGTDCTPQDPYQQFRIDQHCWDGVDYQAYGIIPLSPAKHGYFAIVSPEDYVRVSRFNWSVNIQTDPVTGRILKVYAYRKARKKERDRRAPTYVYLHRYITGVVYSGRHTVVDHLRGDSLDNRRCNLHVTGQRNNIGNVATRPRKKNPELPRGVRQVKRTRSSRRVTLYIGRIRVGVKGELRSKTSFSCPKRAGRWYNRMHKVIHPNACLVTARPVVPPAFVFPSLQPGLGDVPF